MPIARSDYPLRGDRSLYWAISTDVNASKLELVTTAAERREQLSSNLLLRPTLLGLLGLGLLATQPLQLNCDAIVFLTLALVALALAPLTIRLPSEPVPMSLMSLALVPSWLLCGAWPTTAIGVVAW